MIDYESLLEFEESLRSSCAKNNSILLHNLELRIEISRITYDNTTVATGYSEQDLDKAYNEYEFTLDEFATCSKCGQSLVNESTYKACCRSYMESRSLTNLEKSYWLSFLDSPTRTMNTLPNYTELLFLQQGIPNQIRSIVWKKVFLMSNCQVPEPSKLVFQNFQHSYNPEISKQISKDLNRTFPTVSFFKDDKTIKSLSTILNVYANYDAELGYCQGLLFLVGVLYYHFKSDSELTFHALVTIMESEMELHDIFTPSTMSCTLKKWYDEFLKILEVIDKDLFNHLTGFVELQVFLYQWWLSFVSSHSPDLSIVNRIMDFCITQGWKIGFFKISLGLLIINKPILMSLEQGDEEVIYQHLLNESKWGNIINDLDLFFGNLLLSWDDSLFLQDHSSEEIFNEPNKLHYSMMTKFKNLSLNLSRNRSNSDSTQQNSSTSNQSLVSIFSSKLSGEEIESIYSDISETSESKHFMDYLKLPYLTRKASHETTTNVQTDLAATSNDQLLIENQSLKGLLKKAYDLITEDSLCATDLKKEISKTIDV